MKTKAIYRFYRKCVRVFTRPVKTVWQEPFDGQPAIFCPNHCGAWGPVAMMGHFELREKCMPWFNAEVTEYRKMPAYIHQDYWWNPKSKLAPLYNVTIPYLGSVLPLIMRRVPGIKVYHDAHVLTTFRESMAAIQEGDHLIIFPQQPDGYGSHDYTLNSGWLQFVPMTYKRLGVDLAIYPVVIDSKNHQIVVGNKITYDHEKSLSEQQDAIMDRLAQALQGS